MASCASFRAEHEEISVMKNCKAITTDEAILSDDDSSDDENSLVKANDSDPRKRGRPVGSSKTIDEGQPQPKRKKSPLVDVVRLAAVTCCAAFCCSRIDLADVTFARDMFMHMNQHQQTQFIINYLLQNSDKSSNPWKTRYTVGTKKVCMTAWRVVYGMRQARFYKIRKEVIAGQVSSALQGQNHRGNQMQKTQETIEWIESYAANFADKMPHSDKVHLPSCLTQRDVYASCKASMESQGLQAVSESHFYKLWSKHFDNLTIPKVNRFAKCDKCCLIKTKLARTAVHDKETRKLLMQRRDKHLTKQSLERRKYYKHQRKARQHTDQYLSVIIDGMDQSKTYLPHFGPLNSKDTSAMWKLKTHLTGVIVHGHGVYGFFDSCEWPHSSNLTLNVLMRILSMYGSDLPQTLYLQLDNCGRENKNRYVFAFCALLVELGVFRKIKVSFLMVGHTHEDIDQMFSRVATYLQRHQATTMPELISAYENSYTPNPQGIELDHMLDISRWLDPCIEKMSMHSKPHVFRFTRHQEGRALMHVKKWSTDPVWLACDGSANGSLLKERPTGPPSLIPPNYHDIDVERMQADISHTGSKYLSEAALAWWQHLFHTFRQPASFDSDIAEADWLLPRLVEQCRRRPAPPAGPEPPAPLSDLSDEDEPIPAVLVGRKEKRSLVKRQLAVGDMCLLDTEKWADFWPQLAQVVVCTEDDETSVQVRWYRASLTGINRPEILKQHGTGKQIDWVEKVARRDIWLSGFKLTDKGRLPAEVQRQVKQFRE